MSVTSVSEWVVVDVSTCHQPAATAAAVSVCYWLLAAAPHLTGTLIPLLTSSLLRSLLMYRSLQWMARSVACSECDLRTRGATNTTFHGPLLKMIGKGFYSKWVKSSFEHFITTQTHVGSTNGWIISQNTEILKFYFSTFPEIFGICDVISRLRLRWMCP